MYNAFRGMCVADCKIKVLSKRFVDVMYAVTKFRKKVFVLLQMSIISSRGMSVKRESASRFPPEMQNLVPQFSQQKQSQSPWPGLLYRLCNVHKDNVDNFPPIRAILSVINTPTFKFCYLF